MCELTPSATIWGTTQILFPTITTTTLTTLVPGSALTFTITSIDPSDPQKTSVGAITTTPYETSMVTSEVSVMGTSTKIVPQNTLYYPCPTSTSTDVTTSASSTIDDAINSSESQAIPGGTTTSQDGQPSSTRASAGHPSQSTRSLTATGTTSAGQSSSPSVADKQEQSSNHATTFTLGSTATSSSLFSPLQTTSGNTSLSQEGSTPSHSHKSAAIAGGVVGGLIGLVLLFVIFFFLRRRNARQARQKNDSHGDETDGDFWERRFRELEAEGEGVIGGSGGRDEKGGDDWDLSSSRKLHLTLNLESKNLSLSPRPPSRLSTISSFFTKFNNNQSSPFLHRQSLTQPERRSMFLGLSVGNMKNFSRPLGSHSPAGGESILPSKSSTSSRSRRSRNSSTTSKSPKRTSTGSALTKRVSAFILPSTREVAMDDEDVPSPPLPQDGFQLAPRIRRSDEADEMDGRRGMEWMRSIRVSEGDNRDWTQQGWNNTIASPTERTNEDSLGRGGPRPPPPRPLTVLSQPPEEAMDNQHLATLRREPSQSRSDSSNKVVGSSKQARQLSPLSTDSTLDTSRQFGGGLLSPIMPSPTSSMKKNLESRGKQVPQLSLSRQATTPSLWLDAELFARFDGQSDMAVYGGVVDESARAMSLADEKTSQRARGASDDLNSNESHDHLERSQRSSAGSSIGVSTEEVSDAKIGIAERSAVTPQLPVIQLGSSRLSQWDAVVGRN
ncbi:hypothetical protein CI109_105140 [Kwoniella shandongensis]|uniref:Uncharacterized protein n=1 Tax=Kwoniella shandongensis TaxID=1734106 RepID=A0A5M6C3C9_9TREE|nr:uncharacterized protein CI109_001979 [Kwoniella shandongensis]KAA5529554.1 hypothetical protein CI109_001979 [Kwoniella shandongensis]